MLSAVEGIGCKANTPAPPEDQTAARTAALRAELVAHREQQIQRLHEYAVAGEFPRNVTSPTAIHQFRDADGRYCAVANLIHQDGRDELVAEVARDNNALLIRDVHSGGIHDWIATSGLTQEELAVIQFPDTPLGFEMLRGPRRAKPSPVLEVAKSAPKPDSVETMKSSVRIYLANVEADLRANSQASIDLAMRRAL
jgi:hypothetical protein